MFHDFLSMTETRSLAVREGTMHSPSPLCRCSLPDRVSVHCRPPGKKCMPGPPPPIPHRAAPAPPAQGVVAPTLIRQERALAPGPDHPPAWPPRCHTRTLPPHLLGLALSILFLFLQTNKHAELGKRTILTLSETVHLRFLSQEALTAHGAGAGGRWSGRQTVT